MYIYIYIYISYVPLFTSLISNWLLSSTCMSLHNFESFGPLSLISSNLMFLAHI